MLILSWNIYNGGMKNPEEIVKEILNISADILCLQEVNSLIIDSLTHFYDIKGTVTTHCLLTAIFCKKGKFAERIVNSFSYFQSAIGFVIDDVTYISCHLVPYSNNQSFRIEQIDNIIKRVHTKKIVIAGDMNMEEDINLEKYNLVDVDKGGKNTWFKRFFDGKSLEEKRYDRFFVSSSIRVARSFGSAFPEGTNSVPNGHIPLESDSQSEYTFNIIKLDTQLSDHSPILLNIKYSI